MPRKVKDCIECGEEREIFSKGLCSKCLARKRRAEDVASLINLWSPPKRHEADKRKHQRRARRALNAIWNLLEELESPPFLSSESIKLMRALIQPALRMATRALDSDFTEDDSEGGTVGDGPSNAGGRTGAGPVAMDAQADAARLELDQLERTERTARADVESALRNQGYASSIARKMAQAAVGTDFESMLRDALTPRGAEKVDNVNTSEKTEEAQLAEHDAEKGDELTKNEKLLTPQDQPFADKVNSELVRARYPQREGWSDEPPDAPQEESSKVPDTAEKTPDQIGEDE